LAPTSTIAIQTEAYALILDETDLRESLLTQISVFLPPRSPANGLMSQNVPSVMSQEVPSVMSQDVPLVMSQNVPSVMSQNVPLAMSQKVPSVMSQNVPSVMSQNVPLAMSQKVPSVMSQNVPSVMTQTEHSVGSEVESVELLPHPHRELFLCRVQKLGIF
jgi:hypothetical protein